MKLILMMTLMISSCAIPMKTMKREHKGKMERIFAKYRNIFNQYDWELEQSDAAGGFLKAIKPDRTLGFITGINQAVVSCSQNNKRTVICYTKINSCKNTVPISSCGPISTHAAEDKFKEFLDRLKSVK